MGNRLGSLRRWPCTETPRFRSCRYVPPYTWLGSGRAHPYPSRCIDQQAPWKKIVASRIITEEFKVSNDRFNGFAALDTGA